MKANIPLTAGFGNKIFVHGRGWVKRDELQEQVKDQELIRLMELEKKFIKGTDEFLEGLKALREIKDRKLYLQVAETFKQYCEGRLGKSVRAVYEELKMLEISEEVALAKNLSQKENVHNVHKPPLSLRHLRERARIPAKTTMAKTPLDTEPEEEDLFDEIITRIRRAKGNRNFLEALKDWLDESGI